MKVKVKGLVFAGLAAVIFAGSAMAAVDTTPQAGDLDNTTNLNYVTSKKYVDRVVTNAKADTTALAGRVTEAETAIDALEDNAERTSNKAANLADVINASDLANKYPNVGAVKNALADKQDKSDSDVTTAGNYIQTGTGVAANLGRLDTQVKTNADAIGTINSNIGTVPEGSTVMAEIAAAQSAATYDDTALAGRVSANETAITTINSSAPMTSGIDSTKVAQIATNASNITALQNGKEDKTNKTTTGLVTVDGNGNVTAIAAGTADAYASTSAISSDLTKLNTAVTGALGRRYTKNETDDLLNNKQAKSDSNVTTAGHYIEAGTGVGANLKHLDDQVYANETAITTINTNIGTVPAGSTVMAEIAAAQDAATYDDTALAGRVTTIEGYSSAYTSGIDATKVAQIATNASNITNLQTESATHQLISNKATDVTTVAAADKDTKYPTVGAVQAPSSCNSNAPCAWINNAWVPIQQ